MESKPASAAIRAAHRKLSQALAVQRPGRLRRCRPGLHRGPGPGGGGGDRTAGLSGTTTATRFFPAMPRPSVNPSLWRQSTLVAKQGLYEVVEGIYQVRGLDLSNVTLRRGRHGSDRDRPAHLDGDGGRCTGPLPEHRGDRPVVAVIYTHSHVDHFGGVFGVASQDEVDAGSDRGHRARGFVEHAVSENVYAGTAMGRRAGYMYGAALARGPQGQVGAGLGQTTSTGEVGLIRADCSRSRRLARRTRSTASRSSSRWRRGPRRRRRCTSTSPGTGPCAWLKTRPTPCTTC